MKKVVVLGTGMVAKPLVEYLLEAGFEIVLASNTMDRAKQILNGHPNGSSVYWEAGDISTLNDLISGCDLAVSLLPYKFHVQVASVCIEHSKSMVTTSYVQEEMKQLDKQARESGIILLNETGMDPGIDHMSAMRIIDKVHSEGGKIIEFYSLCGALPAPESKNNPFGYKFSWSPKGVILASRSDARYLIKGKRVDIESINLFKDRFRHKVPGVGVLEVYPNRDSIIYIDIYGIPETETIYRGTYRHIGWCEILDSMKSLNMLDRNVSDYSNRTYSDFLSGLLPEGDGSLLNRLTDYLDIGNGAITVEAFRWLGLLEDKDMGYAESSPFEIISDMMIKKMMLSKNDRDMIVLQHLFKVIYPDGRKEVISSHMIDYGSPETNTSISRTVGLPAAIAAEMILRKEIRICGVHIPVIPEIYNPVLDQLEKLGIKIIEEFGLPLSDFIDQAKD